MMTSTTEELQAMRCAPGFRFGLNLTLGSGAGASVSGPPPAKPTLTAPSTGTYLNGESPTISATSTDGDLTRIDFVLVGVGIVATDSTSPYSTVWPINVAPGTYNLIARAVRGGQATDSDPVSVTIGDAELRIDTLIADGNWTSPAAPFLHPDGTRSAADVELHAAGGGGTTNVGAGGGGAYARKKVTGLAASTAYAVAGTAGAAANTDAVDLTFNTTTAVADGGLKGSAATNGGDASASTGDVKRDGGNGASGAGNQVGGGAGSDTSAASGITSGETRGGWSSAGADGRAPGGGGGSQAGTALTGARGEARIQTLVLADQTYPILCGCTYGRDTADTGSRACTMPTGIEAGDLLVLIVGSDGVPTISESGGGWTALTQQNEGTSQCSLRVFYKVATGGDSATIATSSSEAVGYIVLRISNCQSTPDFASTQGNSTNADPPSVSRTGGSGKALAIAIGVWDMGLVNITGVPAGYTGLTDVCSASNIGVRIAIAFLKINAASENPGAFTTQTEQWCAATLLVRP